MVGSQGFAPRCRTRLLFRLLNWSADCHSDRDCGLRIWPRCGCRASRDVHQRLAGRNRRQSHPGDVDRCQQTQSGPYGYFARHRCVAVCRHRRRRPVEGCAEYGLGSAPNARKRHLVLCSELRPVIRRSPRAGLLALGLPVGNNSACGHRQVCGCLCRRVGSSSHQPRRLVCGHHPAFCDDVQMAA